MGKTHSSLLISFLSFKSAPAQKAESELLANTKALVGPFPCSALMASTWNRRAFRSSLEIAFRAFGRLRRRTRTYPDPGAGICCTLIVSVFDEALAPASLDAVEEDAGMNVELLRI